MGEKVAISATILALLSFISAILGICLFLVLWRFHSNERKKMKWKNGPSELRRGWLKSERKPLVPGSFSAKIVQPSDFEEEQEEKNDGWADGYYGEEDKLEIHSVGEIVFILRYLVERDELMVRLVQMEGFSTGEDIYNADSAYVDVLLKHIGLPNPKTSTSPPRLDIALQQVYYFIISQDQLFSYKLVFKVNTFDRSFRRYVSGEVEVDLVEELGQHIFTGNEVILSRRILPVPDHSCDEKGPSSEHNSEASSELKNDLKYPGGPTSPAPSTSPLCWDSECDVNSSKSSELFHYDGVQWHRLSGESWEDNASFKWPYLSDSVVSVPSSFQFNEMRNDLQKIPDNLNIEESLENPLLRRSMSESYIPHYGRLSPPPKNFYHLVPIPLSSRSHNASPFVRNRLRQTTGSRTKGRVFTFDRNEGLSRRRSISLPSLFGHQESHMAVHHGENDVNHFQVQNCRIQPPPIIP